MSQAPFPQPSPLRRMRGFESASRLIGDQVRKAGETRGFAVSRLLTHWAEIAGEDLARITRPVKVGHVRSGFGATLTLLVSSAEAPVVQMQLPKLRERVNACYGYNAIAHISLTQTAPTGFAEGRAEFAALPKTASLPDPAIAREAAIVAQSVQDVALRGALEEITRSFLTRTRK